MVLIEAQSLDVLSDPTILYKTLAWESDNAASSGSSHPAKRESR